ncbi:hypothetical protein HDU76_011999 [Blyttiomyces sp. JEL0837]|nr:hypothetical protein HDU76_011999 [Blyttiomyces sp. JEL0837]
MSTLAVAILTVSDRVSQGEGEDGSGPALAKLIEDINGWSVVATSVVADEILAIQNAITRWTDSRVADLILTTGGTGFGVRDITPEAVTPILDKQAPGLVSAMMVSSLSITPMAALSRPVAGVRKNTIIVTLPGSPKGAKENFQAIAKVLGHAVELARGGNAAGEKTHSGMKVDANAGINVLPATGGHSHGHRHHGGHRHTCSHDHQVDPSVPVRSNDLNAPVTKRSRQSPYPLISYEEALSIVLKHAKPLGTEMKTVGEELIGYVLAADALSTESVPAYRASIVDGYAMVAANGPGTYPVSIANTAGQVPKPLTTGTIARVTTGGMIPEGADAVVMVEDTELVQATDNEEKLVKINVKAQVGDNIREIGSDLAVGEVLGHAGQLISAPGGEVGLIASGGIMQVQVYKQPRVAILSTGNELVSHNHPPPISAPLVRDTNMPTLCSAIRSAMPNVEIIQIRRAADDPASLTSIMSDALSRADIVITTGGVSMGEADIVKSVLEQRIGATIHFGRVQMKPGKPTTFATVKDQKDGSEKLLFGLPGNPVSALVGVYVFVLPALRKISGYREAAFPALRAKVCLQIHYSHNFKILTVDSYRQLAHDVPLDPRPEFHRAHIAIEKDNVGGITLRAHGTGSQLSSRMLSMRGANALLMIPSAGTGGKSILPTGDMVDALLIGNL